MEKTRQNSNYSLSPLSPLLSGFDEVYLSEPESSPLKYSVLSEFHRRTKKGLSRGVSFKRFSRALFEAVLEIMRFSYFPLLSDYTKNLFNSFLMAVLKNRIAQHNFKHLFNEKLSVVRRFNKLLQNEAFRECYFIGCFLLFRSDYEFLCHKLQINCCLANNHSKVCEEKWNLLSEFCVKDLVSSKGQTPVLTVDNKGLEELLDLNGFN